jgi:ferrochelatase
LRNELGWKEADVPVTFQSRFGRAEWLKPYTAEVLRELGKDKTRRVDVFCPGFVADCLETLEEIAIEGKKEFVSAGGGDFHYIPALNDHPVWFKAMGDLAWAQLGGWMSLPPSKIELEMQADRAIKLGAKRRIAANVSANASNASPTCRAADRRVRTGPAQAGTRRIPLP